MFFNFAQAHQVQWWTTYLSITTEREYGCYFSHLLPRDMALMTRQTCFPEAGLVPSWHFSGTHNVALHYGRCRPIQLLWKGWSPVKKRQKRLPKKLEKAVLYAGFESHDLRPNHRARKKKQNISVETKVNVFPPFLTDWLTKSFSRPFWQELALPLRTDQGLFSRSSWLTNGFSCSC